MKYFVSIALVLILLLCVYTAGMLHVLTDAVIYTVDCYDPNNPFSSEWNGYDQRIFIELDGHVFEHGMYQG